MTGYLGPTSVRAMASAIFVLFVAAATLAIWQRKAVVDLTDDPGDAVDVAGRAEDGRSDTDQARND